MRRLIIFLCLVLVCGLVVPPVAATPAADPAPLLAPSAQAIPGQYIVSLKAGARPHDVATSQRIVATAEYTGPLLGFAAALDEAQLTALRHHPQVAAIEPDQVVSLAATQPDPPSWGLDRIDQHPLPLSRSYSPFATGRGVTSYIIDTGLYPDHPDFGGRASVGANFVTVEPPVDLNGHGTHVAGTIGGNSFGVAKQVTLVGVKVLNQSGLGLMSNILAGINWVAQDHLAHPGTPAVANISISGPSSPAVNSAVNALVDAGVFVIVAAGNSGIDACTISPAGASGAFVVAASDINDTAPSFSNYGSCVKLYAPGVAIVSTWIPVGPGIDLNFPTVVLSGTSMAAPHVVGVAALFLSAKPQASPQEIAAWLLATATTNVVKDVPAETPNKLLFSGKLALTATGAATYGDATATLNATLNVDGAAAPIGGARVAFTLNGQPVCRTGATPPNLPACPTTDSQGTARLPDVAIGALGAGKYAGVVCASFAGNDDYAPAGPTCGPLTVARRLLSVKATDRTVGLRQPNPATTPPANCVAQATATAACWLELANGAAFVSGDDWGDLNLTNLRFTYTRNYPNSNASETIGKTYKISATGFSSANYDLRFQQGTLSVTQP